MAEDPDHDGLGNLGEQRWHTNPGLADTDGDGTLDGAEDANGNGLGNAYEQDARPVPAVLVPTLAAAGADEPQSYADGCTPRVQEADRFPACRYGNLHASVQVALVGDSHAAEWFPALLAAVKARGWRLDNYTRSACPWADITTYSTYQDGMDLFCEHFRSETWAAISASVPTIVILTSRIAYQAYDANGQPIPAADYESNWDAGMTRSLAELPAGSIALVLEDTPLPLTFDVPACLQAHLSSIAACERTKATWINAPHAAAEQATAESSGARFGSLNDEVCPYDPCGVIFDELLAYRDNSHLTATFSKSLAPSMGALLDSLLAH